MNILEGHGLTHTFGGLTALDNVSFGLATHEVLGIIGANGSGKSTLLNAVTGHLHAAGSVSVRGHDFSGATPQMFARHGVARTFQSTRLLETLTVLENVLVGTHHSGGWRRSRRNRIAVEALARVGLSAEYQRRVARLSHGQRRRVELARAMAAQPDVLILDEPTAGLFPAAVRDITALIRELAAGGTAVLMVEHDIEVVAQTCSRLLVFEAGAVVDEGHASNVLAGEALARLLPDMETDRLTEVTG